MTRSWRAVPGWTRVELTIVCTRGSVSTRKLSLGARQGVVRPMWFASPGTTCTYAYHPTTPSLAAAVVNVPDPLAASEPVQAGWPSQRIASSVGKGP